MRIALLVSLAALGCGGGHPGDPPPPDAAVPVDAAIDAPADAAITVVRVHRIPTWAYIFVFYDPANQLVARVTPIRREPFGEGEVTQELPAGGTMIAYTDPFGGSPNELRAIFGIEPGDVIDFGAIVDRPPMSQNLEGNDPVPIAMPAVAGAGAYAVSTHCGRGAAGGGAPNVTIYVRPECSGDVEALARAVDSSTDALLGAQRGTITLGAAGDTLPGPWLAPISLGQPVTNGPEALGVIVSHDPVLVDRWLFGMQAAAGGGLAANASATFPMAVEPSTIVDGRQLGVRFQRPTPFGSYPTFQQVHRLYAPTDPPVAFSIATERLPWYDGTIPQTAYDPATRRLTITPGPGAPLDGQYVHLQFERKNDLDPYVWECVFPPGPIDVILPVLPAEPEFFPFDPSDPQIEWRLVFPTGVSASAYPDYAAFRQRTPAAVGPGSTYHITTISPYL